MSEEPRNIDDVTHKTRSVISTAVTSAAIVALFAALTFVPTRTTTHDAPILTHAATSEEVAAARTHDRVCDSVRVRRRQCEHTAVGLLVEIVLGDHTHGSYPQGRGPAQQAPSPHGPRKGTSPAPLRHVA